MNYGLGMVLVLLFSFGAWQLNRLGHKLQYVAVVAAQARNAAISAEVILKRIREEG